MLLVIGLPTRQTFRRDKMFSTKFVLYVISLLVIFVFGFNGVQSRTVKRFSRGTRDSRDANLRHAEKCGYFGLKHGQVLAIQSANFNKITANFEECSWHILGHRCTLKATCPCFDVPVAENCHSDYLKISDKASFSHTFCGENQPVGIFNSTSSVLNFSYRFDGRDTTNGFACYVSCTGKGQRDPPALRTAPVTCRV